MHPGYGFLSENADFVDACESAGVAFLGPTGATMRMFSRKHTAREFAQGAGVPVLPGALPACPGRPCAPWRDLHAAAPTLTGVLLHCGLHEAPGAFSAGMQCAKVMR